MGRGYYSEELADERAGRRVDSPAEELAPSSREENASAAWLLVAVGVGLAVLPLLTESGPVAEALIDVVGGAVVALLALARMARPRAPWLTVLIGLLGVWIVVSGPTLHDGLGQQGVVTVCGVLIVLLAAWSANASSRRDRREPAR